MLFNCYTQYMQVPVHAMCIWDGPMDIVCHTCSWLLALLIIVGTTMRINTNFCAVPPDQPLNLTLDSVSYSWISIHWHEPSDLGTYGIISHYSITVYKVIPHNRTEILITEISTEGNKTCANITGLQPGMTFQIQLQVAGISSTTGSNFNVLGQSASLWANTSIPGKMICMHPCTGVSYIIANSHGTTCLPCLIIIPMHIISYSSPDNWRVIS